MTITEVSSIVGATVGVLGMVIKFHRDNMKAIQEASDKRAEIENKVDRMWEAQKAIWGFQIDRAKITAEKEGLGKKNSPFRIVAAARTFVPPMFAEDLRRTYLMLPPAVREDNDELSIELLKRHREQLLENLCVPHGMTDGECLLIAMAVARGETGGEEA